MYELISMEIAASGMSTQRVRMAVTASNLANANSTRRPDGPGPYRRQFVVVKADTLPTFKDLLSQVQQEQNNGEITMNPTRSRALLEQHVRGVRVLDIVQDQATQTRYLPHHPDADADGNVLFPDISVIQEMTDMISASRNYEANLAVMKNTRDMLLQTIELLQS